MGRRVGEERERERVGGNWEGRRERGGGGGNESRFDLSNSLSDLLTMSSIFKILLTVSAANLMAEVDTSSGWTTFSSRMSVIMPWGGGKREVNRDGGGGKREVHGDRGGEKREVHGEM